jgi:nucleoside-diphosphate-sugar epimerase
MVHTNSHRRYVLVTGATGFIGAHVVDNLLARGFSVRGSTRSKEKGEQMMAARPQYASKLDFVVIEDFTEVGVFDSVMEDIDAVIHVASVSKPINPSNPPN